MSPNAKMPSTRPSLLLAARLPSAEGKEALATLCRLYWYPLYAFVRRRGRGTDEAHDLTQGFFTRLLEREDLHAVDPKRGRFRSWLLSSMTHFLANEWDREQTQKRGGGQVIVSIDTEDAEGRYLAEPSHDLTPEKLYERKWALALLERVLAILGAEYARKGKAALFGKLEGTLTGDGSAPYAQVARELTMSEGAVKVAAYWLRCRYQALLRAEVADTLERPEDVDDEISVLVAAVS